MTIERIGPKRLVVGAHYGLKDWLAQRVTAVVMALFTLVLLVAYLITDEVTYEGYGPQGVAILAQCLTDNKNRSSAEIRSIFTKNNGNMAGAGSVAWIFEKKGLLVVDKSKSECF